MASWIEITEADVAEAISGAEIDGIREAALLAGQPDPIDPTIAAVVADVRASIASNDVSLLGEGNTVPPSLKTTVLDILAFRIPSRVGMDVPDARSTLYRDAVRKLEKVAKGDFDVEVPDEGSLNSSHCCFFRSKFSFYSLSMFMYE